MLGENGWMVGRMDGGKGMHQRNKHKERTRPLSNFAPETKLLAPENGLGDDPLFFGLRCNIGT